jgi:hypothetical protein
MGALPSRNVPRPRRALPFGRSPVENEREAQPHRFLSSSLLYYPGPAVSSGLVPFYHKFNPFFYQK